MIVGWSVLIYIYKTCGALKLILGMMCTMCTTFQSQQSDYIRVCVCLSVSPSVNQSIGPSIAPSVRRSIHHPFGHAFAFWLSRSDICRVYGLFQYFARWRSMTYHDLLASPRYWKNLYFEPPRILWLWLVCMNTERTSGGHWGASPDGSTRVKFLFLPPKWAKWAKMTTMFSIFLAKLIKLSSSFSYQIL